MEGLTRLVSESLARHGFDRPLDYRRLHWSRWFRCKSHHSLLLVPSKPGVFAQAEVIMDFSPQNEWDQVSDPVRPSAARLDLPVATAAPSRRMLAVTRFFEDDDMAFVLDRMLAAHHPMRARLTSGRYFGRFVIIDEESQRRSICNALNQWIANSSEKASSIGSHFDTSLELTPDTEYVPQPNEDKAGVERTLLYATVGSVTEPKQAPNASAKPPLQASDSAVGLRGRHKQAFTVLPHSPPVSDQEGWTAPSPQGRAQLLFPNLAPPDSPPASRTPESTQDA